MFSKTFINIYTFTLFKKKLLMMLNITAMDSMDEAVKSEKLSTLRHNGSHTEVKSPQMLTRRCQRSSCVAHALAASIEL